MNFRNTSILTVALSIFSIFNAMSMVPQTPRVVGTDGSPTSRRHVMQRTTSLPTMISQQESSTPRILSGEEATSDPQSLLIGAPAERQRKAIDKIRAENISLKQELTKVETAMRKQNQTAQWQLNEMKRELAQAKVNIPDVDAVQKIASLTRNNQQLQKDNELLKQDIEDQRSTHEQHIAQLKEQLERLQPLKQPQTIASTTDNIAESATLKQLETKSRELKRAHTEITNQQASINALAADKENLQKQLDMAIERERLSKSISKCTEESEEIAARDTQITRLKQKEQKLKARNIQLSTAIDRVVNIMKTFLTQLRSIPQDVLEQIMQQIDIETIQELTRIADIIGQEDEPIVSSESDSD